MFWSSLTNSLRSGLDTISHHPHHLVLALLHCVPFSFHIFSPAKHSGPYLLSLADWFNLWYRPIFACRKTDAPITHRGIPTFGLVGCGGPHTMVDILSPYSFTIRIIRVTMNPGFIIACCLVSLVRFHTLLLRIATFTSPDRRTVWSVARCYEQVLQ